MYEAEKRFQTKENEFMAYKEQQLTKPEVKLESEINLLKIEKVINTIKFQRFLQRIYFISTKN